MRLASWLFILALALMGQRNSIAEESPKPAAANRPAIYLPADADAIIQVGPHPSPPKEGNAEKDAGIANFSMLILGAGLHSIFPEDPFHEDAKDKNKAAQIRKAILDPEPLQHAMVVLWRKPKDDVNAIRFEIGEGWDGVALFVMKEEGIAEKARESLGFTREVAGERKIWARPEGKDKLPPAFLTITARRVIILSPTIPLLERYRKACEEEETRRPLDHWLASLPAGATGEFWAVLRPNANFGDTEEEPGFIAASTSSRDSIALTYTFPEGKVPQRFQVGKALAGEVSRPLRMEIRAVAKVTELTKSKLTCTLDIGEGFYFHPGALTVCKNLRAYLRIPGGTPSP